MADRPKGYGFSREAGAKLDAKYMPDDENVVVAWMESILDERPPECGRKAFQAWLKDGIILCRLMDEIESGACKKYHDPITGANAAMRKIREMENISLFLKAVTEYGVSKTDLFQTVDLYENQNMAQVLTTLMQLSSHSMKKGYEGPNIGVKIADKNVRGHDEQTLREGRSVIGLQMGTNQVASQQGMTPYGLGRQIAPTK
ncbi:calponin-1-like [Clavelina lepadiformis]|uniref:Transgelin n=1 Tax=Clavelina lepadiformis TaxID=159417 RepID=A0ABP0FI59_CLALP